MARITPYRFPGINRRKAESNEKCTEGKERKEKKRKGRKIDLVAMEKGSVAERRFRHLGPQTTAT